MNKLIEQLKNEEKTIIILSHELEKCLALADKMIVLHKGKIVFDGTAKDGILQDLEQWNFKKSNLQLFKNRRFNLVKKKVKICFLKN